LSARYCGNCAAPLVEVVSQFCDHCGARHELSARFCRDCGTPFIQSVSGDLSG
jgi:predicted amidophosphoribosyltransferase